MPNTPETWAARNAARIAIWILVAVLVAIAVWQVRQWRADAKEGAARIEARDETAAAAGAIAEDLTSTTTDQQRVEVQISADTRQLAIDLESLRRENPTVEHWLSGPIPDELRELARKRREARDRLTGAADGGGSADPGTPADGSDPAR